MARRMKAKRSTSSKRYMAAIIFLIITVFLGVVLYSIVQESLKTTEVVVASKNIRAGSVISEGDLATISVGKQGLQSNIATNKTEVVGKYATRDLVSNEYIFSSSLTNDYMKRLSEKAKFGAIAVPISNLQAVTGDIKENDFVGAYISVSIDQSQQAEMGTDQTSADILPNVSTALIYPNKLNAIRVLGLYDGGGQVAGKAEARVDAEGKTVVVNPSMVVFDATPEQRVLLLQSIDNGSIRLMIHPEYIQRAHRKIWGLEGSDAIVSPEEELNEQQLLTDKEAEQKKIIEEQERFSESPVMTNYMDGAKEENKATITEEQGANLLTPTEGIGANN